MVTYFGGIFLQLHKYEYDTGKALQALVKAPALRTIDKKWNEEDTVSFDNVILRIDDGLVI